VPFGVWRGLEEFHALNDSADAPDSSVSDEFSHAARSLKENLRKETAA